MIAPLSTCLAGYLRDSGGEDQDLSVAQQEAALRAWCVARGLTLTRIFKDEARPGGSTVGREAFHEMMTYFKKGIPEKGVVVWKFDRFARNMDDAQFYKADLRRRGFEIYSMHDTLPEGVNGRFFEAALDWMAHKFREDLSVNVKRGQHFIVKEFGAVPGTPPRGFQRQAVEVGTRRDGTPHVVHRWVPKPGEWERCKLAWEMRAGGASYRAIHQATQLYSTKNSYPTFFRNEIYRGVLRFADLVIEGYCEPMITQEGWDAVQRLHQPKEVQLRENHPRRAVSQFLLTGLVFCAECGGAMNGEVINTKEHRRRWAYYLCNHRQRFKACPSHRVPQDLLEEAILEDLVHHLGTAKHCQAVHELSALPDETHTHEEARLVLLQKIEHVQAQLSRALELLLDPALALSKALAAKIQTLEAEKEGLIQQLAAFTPPAAQEPLVLEELPGLIRTALWDGELRTRQEIIRAFIQRIEVSREKNGPVFAKVIYWGE